MSIRTERISFPANGGSGEGYLALPDGDGVHPAVVVIQEWWGLNEHIEDVTERFAAAGYVALAPDLYHGAITAEPDEAMKLVMAMKLDEANTEMAGAAAYLVGRDDVAPKKVGVIGFCVGGSLALMMASNSAHVGAVASFYGGREVPEEQIHKITAPVLAIYGSEDQGLPPARREKLDSQLTASNLPHEIHVYPGADHAFFNDTRAEVYNAPAANDAWERTLAWFKRYLV